MENNYTTRPNLDEYNPNQPFSIEISPFNIEKYCIFSCISGSRAYGTSTETSDIDKRGVILSPIDMLLGMRTFEQIENQTKDICYYNIKKFFTLLYRNNPHAMEILYMKDTVTFSRPPWNKIITHKDIFTSKLIGHSFYGYALQQLQMANVKKQNHTGRINLLEKYGFDTKLSSHCLRLLRSGKEFLKTGNLIVNRPDAAELLEIKNGKYSYEEFVQWDQTKKKVIGGFIKNEFDTFDEAFKNCKLPDKPNFDKVNNLLIKIQKEALLNDHLI